MNNTKRVVPWKNRNEFEGVYREIFGNSTNRQIHGLERISVWRSRVLHKLPVAIESTLAIVQAMANHQRAKQSGDDVEQDSEIRSLYSLALIRFVNHITEKGQTKEYAQPVHLLASEYGVPEWIVELRHSATHGKLPSLSMLTAACDWALHWLKTEFWEEQLVSMAIDIKKNKKKSRDDQIINARDILENYQQEKLKELNENASREITGKILENLDRIPTEERDELVTCAADDGFLIPTREQLDALRIDISKIESPGNPLPSSLVLFWKPVLRFLQHFKLTEKLLTVLVSKVTRKSCIKNHVLCGWIECIVSSNEPQDEMNSKRNPMRIYKWTVPLSVKPLLQSLIHIPCKHTMPVINLLLAKGQRTGEYSERQVTQIYTAVELLQNSIPPDQSILTNGKEEFPEDNTVHRVEDVLKTRKRKLSAVTDEIPNKRRIGEIERDRTVWKKCTDDVDWSKVPIGILPGQALNYFTLDLSPDCDESFLKYDETTRTDHDTAVDESEEYLSEDEAENPSSMWSSVQMTEIKNGIKLI